MTNTTKNIIGKPRIRNYEIGDTDELLRRANSYVEPLKEKEKKTSQNKIVNPISIQDNDKYEYFFAGENEYNIYKEFVEKNFYKKQDQGLQTLEELAKPELNDKLFKGSNPFINSAMNMVLRDKGINIVTQAQLEYVYQNNLLNLKDIYSDTGMCLRTDSGENENHALISQLQNPNLPVYIPVIAYDLIKDGLGNLSFRIVDKSKVIYLPILNSPDDSKFNNSDIDMKIGFPMKFYSNGNRTLWTRQYGLSRCYLNRSSVLGSSYSDLSDSNEVGRVVLAKVRKS